MSEVKQKLEEIQKLALSKVSENDTEIASLKNRIEQLEAGKDIPRGAAANDGNGSAFESKALTRALRTGEFSKLREEKAMTIASNASGGYTHVAELGKEIISAVGEINPIMAECNKVTIDANEFNQIFTTSRSATARAAESGTRSESNTATFVRTDVTLYDLYAYPKITNELLNSSQFDLNAWIRQDITEAFDEALATEFVTGDGSSQSVGLLNSMSSNALGSSPDLPWGSLYFVSGQSSPEAITYDALLSVISALPVRYKLPGNAKWYMSTSAIEEARSLLDANNLPIWRQDFGVTGGELTATKLDNK